MKRLKKLMLCIAVIYAPLQSMAWGLEGHRVCGQIADSYLTAKARLAIKEILGDESIAIASNWADFIKSDPNFSYLSVWHYIDFDKPYSYPDMVTFLDHDTNIDAYTKIQFMIGELKKSTTTKENKLLYLRMLIHIVEDVHQPFHVGRAEDKGGNDIKITYAGASTNMHSLWDSKLIENQQLSYTEYTVNINHTTWAQRNEWQKAPISLWLFESNQIAEKLYSEVKTGDVVDGYKYNFAHIDIVNKQLLKGGVRLAGLLNQIFG